MAGIEDLATRIESGNRLTVLAGSGISVSAGIPTAQQLARQFTTILRRRGVMTLPSSYSELIRLALKSRRARHAFFQRACFGRRPQKEHILLAELMKREFLAGIITTNFDQLLEEALLLTGGPTAVVSLPESELGQSLFPCKGAAIAKIHGDFLFEEIKNLPEELGAAIKLNMENALLGLTAASDLLVLGYSGTDFNVMTLLRQVVRNAANLGTRVFWSEFEKDPLIEESQFSDLLQLADRVGNPIVRLGPWPAADCLRELIRLLNVSPPRVAPFGLSGGFRESAVHHLPPVPSLPGNAAIRNAAISQNPRFLEFVRGGGLTVLFHEDIAGGSTLLAAAAERVAPRAIYFDVAFAQLPPQQHLLDLCVALQYLLSRGGTASPKALFGAGAVVVVDGLLAPGPGNMRILDGGLLQLVIQLVEGALESGVGSLVLGFRCEREALHARGRADPLIRAILTSAKEYILRRPIIVAGTADDQPESTLLDVLALSQFALPTRQAMEVARANASELSEPATGRLTDRRGDRVLLRPLFRAGRLGRIPRRTRERLARRLSVVMRNHALTLPYMLRASPLLLAETLAFGAEPSERWRGLEILTTLSLKGPVLVAFSQHILHDYLAECLEDAASWKNISVEALSYFLAEVAPVLYENGHHDVIETLFDKLVAERHWAERAAVRATVEYVLPDEVLIASRDEPRSGATEGARQFGGHTRREDCLAQSRRYRVARIAIDVRRGAKEMRHGPEGHVRLVRMLSDLCRFASSGSYSLAEEAALEGAKRQALTRRALRWAQRAESFARACRDTQRRGAALDNQVPGLIELGSGTEAAKIVRTLLSDTSRIEGFSPRKALVLANASYLGLKSGKFSEAEAYFFAAVLQYAALGQHDGVLRCLAILERAAKQRPDAVKADLLPPETVIQERIREVRARLDPDTRDPL